MYVRSGSRLGHTHYYSGEQNGQTNEYDGERSNRPAVSRSATENTVSSSRLDRSIHPFIHPFLSRRAGDLVRDKRRRRDLAAERAGRRLVRALPHRRTQRPVPAAPFGDRRRGNSRPMPPWAMFLVFSGYKGPRGRAASRSLGTSASFPLKDREKDEYVGLVVVIWVKLGGNILALFR